MDKNIIEKIVQAVEIPDSKAVVELGPGTGALTLSLDQCLAVYGGKVIAIEIDERAISHLKGLPLKVTTVIHKDMLQCDLRHLAQELGSNLTIVSNLPYNISGPMLAKLFDEREYVSKAILMVQKEVAERVMSPPGTKQYGVLSVFIQYAYEIERLFLVPKNAFHPRPKVQSMVIRLKRRIAPPDNPILDESLFKRVVRCAFQMRRKKLKNALLPLVKGNYVKISLEEMLTALAICGDNRPEMLSSDDFIKISNKLREYI